MSRPATRLNGRVGISVCSVYRQGWMEGSASPSILSIEARCEVSKE
jgi:hypothetical protein